MVQGATDATGAYRVCGLPAESDVLLYAVRDSAATGRVPVSSREATVILRDLTLGNTVSSAGRQANLSGRVVTGSGAAVAGANVILDGTSRTGRSDAKGEFSLSGLPLGTHSVTVSRLGYAPVTIPIVLTSTGNHRVNAVLSEYALQIDPTYVVAQRDRGLARVGFTERSKRGVGSYRTRAQFERDNPTYLSDILMKMRGLRLDNAGSGRSIRAAGAGTECVQLVIDGLRWEPDVPGVFDEAVFPQHVAAVEVYSGAAVPAEFEQGLSRGCTHVLIWTRTRVNDLVEKPKPKR